MNRDRIRKISLIALLVLAVAAFAYFGLVRRQPRHEMAMRQEVNDKDVYYCPMHKDYHSDKPGNCPICSMKLVKLEGPSETAAGSQTGKADAAATISQPPPAANPATQNNAIFVPPEKQQLIGMRSVAAEMGALTK